MENRTKIIALALAMTAISVNATTTTSNDSISKEKKDDRNVMLNAADANKPREIQIGLT